MTETQYLSRPQGRIAYDLSGDGPLVVCVPGMGDLRSTYRHLAPGLVAAGYTAVTVDLRGHGDSDTGFDSYGDVETAEDLAALLDSLGRPAVIVGNSMGAGAGAYLAAIRPELVTGLVLLGPFVRDAETSVLQRLLLRVAMAAPWAAMSWKAYLPKLYAGRRPEDLDEHLALVSAALRRPGYARAFSQTTRLSHAPAAERLHEVSTPTLVVMGELDPDFPDPAAEAAWIADQLDGEVLMVPEAGHYPQAQRADLVTPAVVAFLESVGSDA
ncbi:alpha/beta fold hydrolase [Nocardioides sp.]|uniref:alpha/beta fold hydrolase n=1 Tax=Nocardioides sp. TaxID=35761 RepID=UPI003527C3AA